MSKKGAAMSYFPMFIDLEGRKCLVAGGGKVAYRKVKVLKDFGADIVIIAPEITTDIFQMENVQCIQKAFEKKDLENMELVVAATGNKELNHQISQECRKLKIPVNAVDQTEDCDFIFPSYVKQGEVTGAFTSGGQSPVVTQYLKKQAQSYVTEYIGQMAQCLGDIREEVKLQINAEKHRKRLYQNILLKGLESGQIPSQEEVKKEIALYCKKLEEE